MCLGIQLVEQKEYNSNTGQNNRHQVHADVNHPKGRLGLYGIRNIACCVQENTKESRGAAPPSLFIKLVLA